MSPIPSAHASSPGDRLWAFAVDLYARDGVADACLALQDDHGLDTPMLLFAAWAGAEGGLALSAGQLAQAAGGVSGWQDEVIAGLRALRRRLKAGPPPAPNPATEALRDAVKRAELAAERIELDELARIASPWLAAGGGDDAATAVGRNLDACLAVATGRRPEGEAAILVSRVAEAALAWAARTAP